MSRRHRARKDRREAWYNLTAGIWKWAREAERGYDFVPPPPHPDEYHLLPVLDIRNFYTEGDWYAQQTGA